ncbi:DMT family transporter [Arenibacterium halophilum]|nr:DMT family transporter [Arenibacterium halophilum]
MQPNTRAALFMIASMAAFTMNDTLVKVVGSDVPLFQLVTLRGILASVLIYILAQRFGGVHFRLSRGDWSLIGLRCLGEVSATYFFLTALMHMPLANVTAVLQVLPLTVTLGAVLFFGESVGWKRAVAIAVGFAGMLLIVRPGPDGFSIYSLYALGAVACVTLRDLSTRRMSADVPSMTVTFLSAVSVCLAAAIASLGSPWQPVAAVDAGLIVLAGVCIAIAYLFSILVMRVGDISFTAPFRYTGLVWALVLGWFVFGDWPSNLTLLGGAIVVGSGMFMFHREKVVEGDVETDVTPHV